MLQRIDYRKVLEDDKAGKMKVEVQQVLTRTTIIVCLLLNKATYMRHTLAQPEVAFSGGAMEVFGVFRGVLHNPVC